MKSDTFTTVVPFFPGLYNSELDSMIDREIEDYMEYRQVTYDYIEGSLDYSAARSEISKQWLHRFNGETGFKLEYVGIDSPREYNFTTDRLMATISLDQIVRARESAEANPNIFSDYLRANFTSCDGFYSFYSNDIEDWDTPTDKLDINEIMTYLAVAILVENDESDLLHNIHDYSSVYEAAAHIWKY